jgi:hypothetical protein
MKAGFYIIISVFLGGCVNINGIRNPTIPYEISKNMYLVSLGIRSPQEARADLFLFCEQKEQIYKEVTVTEESVTFYCLDTGHSSDQRGDVSRHAEK